MTAGEVADVIHDHLESEGNADMRKSIDKHPGQNAYLAQISSELNSRGTNCRLRNQNVSFTARPIVIVFDDHAQMTHDGVFDTFINAPQPRWFVTIGSIFDAEDFQGDYILDLDTTVEDMTTMFGYTRVQIWKRVKLRI
jgi:hypothetical protein